jgi:hypothetical protein
VTAATAIDFQLNEFATVSTQALALRRAGDTVELTVAVEPEQWETIDLLELFHLGLAHRHEGSVSGAQPVQIELRLDPAVAAGLAELPADPEAVTAAPAGSPLRDNTSWYALAVTEAVDLPPGMTELGEVRSGFATAWADRRS